MCHAHQGQRTGGPRRVGVPGVLEELLVQLGHPEQVVQLGIVIGDLVRRDRAPLERYGQRPLSRFVGRERELVILQDLLGHVEAGQGQVVGLMGAPGADKTRLL
jgi:hypothetical protein